MKSRSLFLGILLATLLSSELCAEELIFREKQIKLHHLAGTVVDPAGFPIEYATVELRDPKDNHVIASTFADAQGRFSFADHKRGEHLAIRASNRGFNIVQYNVVIRELGKSKLRVILTVAT